MSWLKSSKTKRKRKHNYNYRRNKQQQKHCLGMVSIIHKLLGGLNQFHARATLALGSAVVHKHTLKVVRREGLLLFNALRGPFQKLCKCHYFGVFYVVYQQSCIPLETSALGRLNRTHFDDAQFTHACPHMLM